MAKRVWVLLVTTAVGFGLVVGGGVAGSNERQGGTLRIAAQGDAFASLDPAVVYDAFTWWLEYATCAKLYNYPDKSAPEGATVGPEVATRLPSVSKDGKTQTIELKRTYRFQDGSRITAANFVAAFNRDADAKLQSPAVQNGYLHEIVGADAVTAGAATTISGVSALGPYTLRIRTTRPLFDLVPRLTMPFFCPIPVGTPLEKIDHPLGSGPYFIASHIPNRQLVLKRNPFYRGRRPAHVDEIVFNFGVGPAACQAGIERDEFDYCQGLPGIPRAAYRDVVERYGLNRPGGRVFFNPTLSAGYFAFNHDRPAFKGPGQIPLKQAINWALDRRALAAEAGYLGGKRTDQILPPALGRDASIYPLGPVTEQRMAKARALLAKARFKPETLVLYVENNGLAPAWAQIFQVNLKRLGIEVDIKYFGPTAALAKAAVRGEPYDVLLVPWIADYADPISFFVALNGDNIKKTGNTNYAYFDRPRYNQAIRRIAGLSGEARRRAWADLDVEMMRDDPPWAPFVNGARLDFVSESFGCYVFQPALGWMDIAAACKK